MEAHQLVNQNSGNAEWYTPAAIVGAARRALGGQILFRGEWYTLYTWRWDAFAGMWRACGGCNLYPAYRMVNEWRYDHAALVKRTDNRARFINTMRYW